MKGCYSSEKFRATMNLAALAKSKERPFSSGCDNQSISSDFCFMPRDYFKLKCVTYIPKSEKACMLCIIC